MNLPGSFTRVLEKYGITKKDIVFAAVADLDEQFRFADSIVALTEKKLVVAKYPYMERQEYRLGGYDSWAMHGEASQPDKASRHRDETAGTEPAVLFYDLEDVEKLEVLRQVSTGVLMGKIKGVEQYLCQFSNTKMEAFMRISRLLEKTKKGEEISKEDLDVKRGKECCPKCGMIYPDQERKVCPKCMDKSSILWRTVGYFKPYKGRLIVMMLCYLATAGLNLIWPYLSGTVLYDKVLAKDESFLAAMRLPAGRFLLALGVLVIVMILTKVLIQALGILQGVLTARIAPEVVSRLKSQVFDSMGRLSISFFTKRQTGGLMTRVSDDADEISSFFIDGIPYFFINVGTIVATCVIMIVLNPLLALVSIVLMPVLFFISYRMMPRMWHYYGKRHRANRRLNSQMNENLTGARVVKAFGQEEQEKTRFQKSNTRVRDAEVDVAGYDCRFSALYYLVEDSLTFLVWAVGSALIISGSNMELGLLITFSGYVGQLKGPLEFMSRIFRWYTGAMNSAQRMFEIIDAGEVLGIVGRSGAGKSTLVNLISRLYDAGEGEVLVDGINVKRYGFKELRKNVAMVSQETYIFQGTVAENIAYARPDATREEILSAAVQASSVHRAPPLHAAQRKPPYRH